MISMNAWRRVLRPLERGAFWIVVLAIILSPVLYTAMLNWLGPSTEYHDPVIGTAVKGPDGKDYVYVGDEFYVWITIVRHKLNGNCLFEIERFAEATDGPNKGVRRLISKTALQFIGQNELRRTRWPVPSEAYILGYEVDKQSKPQLDKPLLPDGVDQQEFEFYVVGRYFCNFLDYLIPRHIQGGQKPDETPRVRAIVKRTKP